jgi:hypothetical protein
MILPAVKCCVSYSCAPNAVKQKLTATSTPMVAVKRALSAMLTTRRNKVRRFTVRKRVVRSINIVTPTIWHVAEGFWAIYVLPRWDASVLSKMPYLRAHIEGEASKALGVLWSNCSWDYVHYDYDYASGTMKVDEAS